MTVFTPDNEPYLGRESVYQLDTLLTLFVAEQVRIGSWTQAAEEMTPLQRAARELVPSASPPPGDNLSRLRGVGWWLRSRAGILCEANHREPRGDAWERQELGV